MTNSTANSTKTVKPKGKRRGGSWKPGQSGNPGGRPKDAFKIAEYARQFSTEAIDKIVAIMRDPNVDVRAVIAAAIAILDRGIGKPMQPTQQQLLGADGQPIRPDFVVNVTPYPESPPAPEAAAGAKDTRH
jgi:Family of unknown function (DUF5681)